MPSRFLNNITVNDSYTLPSADGSVDQLITTDGAGQLSFVDQGTIAAESAEVVEVPVKNVHTATILKGTPVYISGSVGSSGRLEVKPADAGVAESMPALGLLKQDLAVNGEGLCVITGKLRNLITSPIDGVTTNDGDVVYVKAGGGLTTIKPTGSANLIQNMGKVGRSSTSNNGTFIVSSILRSNDVPNLTTGKIWVGDGNTVESTVVHLDEVNGRMGIGTSNPATKLHISDATTPEVRIQDTTNNRYLSLYQNDSNSYIQSSLNSPLVFSTHGSNERMRITTSGNVGIGTTIPSHKLTINASNDTTALGIDFPSAHFDFSANSTSNYTSNFRINDVGMDIGHDSTARSLNLQTGNLDRLTILGNGNVGIGTINPPSKVSISGGTLSVSGSGAGFGIVKLGDPTDANPYVGMYRSAAASIATSGNFLNLGGYDGIAFTTGQAQLSSQSEKMRITLAGDVGIGTDSPNRLLTVETTGSGCYLALNSSSNNTTIGSDVNGAFIVYDDSSATYRMVIDQTTGNVGIGTTNPGEKLDVNGVIRGEQYLRLADTGGTNRFSIRAESTYGTIDNGSNTLNYNANNHLFLVGLSEKMRIANNGNVGIGTTSPTSAKLVVAGDVDVWNSTNTLLRSSHNGSYGSFQTFTGGLYGILALNPGGGNVGIGTDSPNAKLEVAGSTRITGSGLDVGYGNNDTNFIQVGLGRTTNGFALLDLIGDSTYTDYGFRILRNNGGPNTDTDILHRGTGDLDLKTVDAGDIGFHTTSIQRMIVKSNGDVGINTTNPSEKLDVNGTVKATDYKGYLPAFQSGGFIHTGSTSSTTIYWIPTNSTSETTSSQSYNNWVAPYNGRVRKIVMRWASNSTPTATSVTFRYQVNSTTSTSTFPATVTDGASTNMTVTKAFGDTDITFNAGDRVQLGFTTNGGTRLLQGFSYTVVLEYNKD